MVKIINDSIFEGIGGNRPTHKPKAFVLHNDAGKMTPEDYQGWLRGRFNSGQAAKGFAHYYINRNTILRAEDTYNVAWACGDWHVNQETISYEVCEEYKVNDEEFLENENMVLRQMAVDMAFYGMKPDYNNIKFHQEFIMTSCPSRSKKLHGGDIDKLRDYVIKSIAYYQELLGNGDSVQEILDAENATPKGYWTNENDNWQFLKASGVKCKNEWQPIKNKWYYFDNMENMYRDSWLNYNNKWYYFGTDGALVTNTTLTINGKEYEFNDDGSVYSEKTFY